ncbi:hypothetical protein NPIL_468651 [Nephila pilipes]|uniref:Uncharacterized protein n=1 Tax=Nephila pilipes TaxID=299642 RepID=A0A8X6UHC2_NEPPI|nr:hypothetical protein NPIL_468651 [Nephila pilipes]
MKNIKDQKKLVELVKRHKFSSAGHISVDLPQSFIKKHFPVSVLLILIQIKRNMRRDLMTPSKENLLLKKHATNPTQGCWENTSTVFPWSTRPDNWVMKKVSRSSRRSRVTRPAVDVSTQTRL